MTHSQNIIPLRSSGWINSHLVLVTQNLVDLLAFPEGKKTESLHKNEDNVGFPRVAV